MVFTKDFELPSDEELNTQELNVTWPYIHAAAVFLGKKCEWINNEFMLCRDELKDPRKCLKEGRQVTQCALEGLQDIKKHCRPEFETLVDCMLDTSKFLEDKHCRKIRDKFDKCMLEKLNMERPDFGYFAEARVHDSPRPKPPDAKIEFKEPVPPAALPPYPPPKHGVRGIFFE